MPTLSRCRAVLIVAIAAVAPSAGASQQSPNFPETFGALVTPRSLEPPVASVDVSAQPVAAVKAVVTAVRLGDYLAVTAVGWLPEGAEDVALLRSAVDDPTTITFTSSPPSPAPPKLPFAKTFFIDLNDDEATELRGTRTLRVVQPGGERESVPVRQLPLPMSD